MGDYGREEKKPTFFAAWLKASLWAMLGFRALSLLISSLQNNWTTFLSYWAHCAFSIARVLTWWSDYMQMELSASSLGLKKKQRRNNTYTFWGNLDQEHVECGQENVDYTYVYWQYDSQKLDLPLHCRKMMSSTILQYVTQGSSCSWSPYLELRPSAAQKVWNIRNRYIFQLNHMI